MDGKARQVKGDVWSRWWDQRDGLQRRWLLLSGRSPFSVVPRLQMKLALPLMNRVGQQHRQQIVICISRDVMPGRNVDLTAVAESSEANFALAHVQHGRSEIGFDVELCPQHLKHS